MCLFSLLGNFECGNPEKLKSKCIPVLEAQEYIAVSGLWAAPCGLLGLLLISLSLQGLFPFLFVLGLFCGFW